MLFTQNHGILKLLTKKSVKVLFPTGDGAPPNAARLLGSSSATQVGLGALPVLGVGGAVLYPFVRYAFGTGPTFRDCLYRA